MLSRSTSTTNSNLRSTRSARSLRGQTPANTLVDPVAAKRHALVAATVAYERAHGEENASQPKRQLEELRRRRSSRASGFEGEGSHFTENRTPRRRQSKRFSDPSDATSHHPRSRRGTVTSTCSTQDQISQSSLSRVSSANNVHESEEKFKLHRSSISVHKLRKAKSMYSSSSHARVGSIDEIAFDPPNDPPQLPQPLEEDNTEHSRFDMHKAVNVAAGAPVPLSRDTLENEQPTFEHQPRSIRNRASLVLTPFTRRKKLPPSASPLPMTQSFSGATYETVVRPPGPVTETTPRLNRKRASSEVKKIGAFAAKIRSVLRRSSMPSRELPVQQVNASRAYFGTPFSVSEQPETEVQPNSAQSIDKAKELPLLTYAYNTGNLAYGGSDHGTKSRVTSWADSTIAGTVVDHGDEPNLASIVEESPLQSEAIAKEKESISLGFLRRMRRLSKAELQSQDVEPKLQIDSTSRQSSGTKSRSSGHQSRRMSGARETLPSQVRRCFTFTNTSIRAVAPEVDETSPQLPAVVSEEPSGPDMSAETSDHSVKSTVRRRNRLQKALPSIMNAPIPTAEQLAERTRRSDDRWQEPLDGGHSLFYPRSPKRASPDRHSRQTSTETDKEIAEEYFSSKEACSITDRPRARSAFVVSPSVYSDDQIYQNLDCMYKPASIATTPPEHDPGTAVVIATRPVSRYSVGASSTSAAAQARRTSRDWRNWLQAEVQDLDTASSETFQLSTEFVKRNPDSGHHREMTEIGSSIEDEEGSGNVEEYSRNDFVPPGAAFASTGWHHTKHQSMERSENDNLTADSRQSMEFITNNPPSRPPIHPHGRASRLSGHPQGAEDYFNVRSRTASTTNDQSSYAYGPRPLSRISVQARTPAQSLPSGDSRPLVAQRTQSGYNQNKENYALIPTSSTSAMPTRQRPPLRRPKSVAKMDRSQSSMARYASNEEDVPSEPPTPRLSLLPRPVKSSPQRPSTSLTTRADAGITGRQLKHMSMPSLETDPTLAIILQGPYRNGSSPSPLSLRKATSYSRDGSPLKENSAPPTPRVEVPTTPTSGQRLAEQFLNARRYREDLNVVSPADGSPMGAFSEQQYSPAFL